MSTIYFFYRTCQEELAEFFKDNSDSLNDASTPKYKLSSELLAIDSDRFSEDYPEVKLMFLMKFSERIKYQFKLLND